MAKTTGSRSIPKGGSWENAPEGTHNATCVNVIDLGTQEGQYEGKPTSARKIQLGFELDGPRNSKGEPFYISKTYTYSASPKSNLMKDLKSWLKVTSGEYDMENCLSKIAMVTIAHVKSESNGNVYANIVSIVAPLSSTKKLKQTQAEHRSLFLDETFDQDAYDNLSDNLKEKIADSPEFMDIMAELNSKKGGKKPGKK